MIATTTTLSSRSRSAKTLPRSLAVLAATAFASVGLGMTATAATAEATPPVLYFHLLKEVFSEHGTLLPYRAAPCEPVGDLSATNFWDYSLTTPQTGPTSNDLAWSSAGWTGQVLGDVPGRQTGTVTGCKYNKDNELVHCSFTQPVGSGPVPNTGPSFAGSSRTEVEVEWGIPDYIFGGGQTSICEMPSISVYPSDSANYVEDVPLARFEEAGPITLNFARTETIKSQGREVLSVVHFSIEFERVAKDGAPYKG